ncbi:unnamed protein product [Arctia plantaginis]|uniref:BEN domain-containing protein n=1 Tax=Arctia plantaginis TaxID=874455 RepID=A0A8S0ZD04_ARCPL|nr:unnamed protein product [Arctia plantaginis]
MWALSDFSDGLWLTGGKRKAIKAFNTSIAKKEIMAGPNYQNKGDENGDGFTSSSSEWEPYISSAKTKAKKVKLERYKRPYSRSNSTIITPSNKAAAVSAVPISIQSDRLEPNQSQNKSNSTINNTINLRDTIQKFHRLDDTFIELLELIKQLKLALGYCKMPLQSTVNLASAGQAVPVGPNFTTHDGLQGSSRPSNQSLNESKQNDNNISENEEFNRSDDNVLITYKYNTVSGQTTQENEEMEQEWVPIGFGKTMIHKDQYKKINWKSYTTATRSLLVALFPRKVLATHSLTGKPSPAFRNKAAKMCLDQNKISAVIMEVVNRFKVRENFVRNIITIKCADECKMWKARCKRNASENKENLENKEYTENE